jgi:hypothetical protein
MTKRKMNNREFHIAQDILGNFTEICNDLAFEDVDCIFLEWQTRLNWVIENVPESYSESSKENGSLFGRHSQGILSARLLDSLKLYIGLLTYFSLGPFSVWTSL